jgi:hypothetical protein
MELRPTPESWRLALLTGVGALAIAVAGVAVVALRGHSVALLVTGVLIIVAALATFVPALGALTAVVDADIRGVSVRRFGRTSRYRWADVVAVRVIERMANVPDGTEYHWFVPSRSKHLVAVPCLELIGGRIRQLPALAAPADGRRRAAATEQAKRLAHLRGLTATTNEDRFSEAG